MDNIAAHQFLEFFDEALANLKKALPQNWKKILKDGPRKKEHIEALKDFAHCVQQFTNFAKLGFRASIGVTGLLEKKLDAFDDEDYSAKGKRIIKEEIEGLEFCYYDQLQKIRYRMRILM